MLDKIIATFCILDDLLHILHQRDDPQAKITDSEILTIAIVACQEFGGNMRQSPPVGHSPSPLLVCAVREPKCRRLRRLVPCLHILLPRCVHAVTLDGFMLKMCFVYAHNLNLLHKVAS